MLIGDAKQAKGEEESGPVVETRLTGPVAMALHHNS